MVKIFKRRPIFNIKNHLIFICDKMAMNFTYFKTASLVKISIY